LALGVKKIIMYHRQTTNAACMIALDIT